MTYQVHNLDAATDTWCGDYNARQAAEEALLRWRSAWRYNRYVIKDASQKQKEPDQTLCEATGHSPNEYGQCDDCREWVRGNDQ